MVRSKDNNNIQTKYTHECGEFVVGGMVCWGVTSPTNYWGLAVEEIREVIEKCPMDHIIGMN